MFPTHRLETPPPTSQFRRPWSPEPFDPNPRSSLDQGGRGAHHDFGHFQQRRERSDVSVEALDLADYALTLARQTNAHAAPGFEPYSAYPPSPHSFRPLSIRDYPPTPPLLSPSTSTSHSHSGASPYSPRSRHRPFSLPAPVPRHPALQTYPTFSSHDSAAHDIDPLRTPPPEPEAEIDIAQFPAFTRGWYPDPKTNKYDPISRLQLDPFDPSFPTQEYNSYSSLPPLYSSPNISRSREIGAVPWSSELDGTPVDSEVKEERIRMLEREFAGKNGIGKGEEEEHIIGSVDSKGKLITEGPKKRLAVRCLQTLLALLAGGSSIYAALVIKPPSPPPPASKPPAYVLYILSVITFLLTAYLFFIYPTCCGSRKRKSATSPFTEGPSGMMVLPVSGLPGGKSKKKGRNKKGQGAGEGVQVNLIVDPGMFGNRRDEEEAGDDDSESEYTVPGSYSGRSRGRGRGRRGHRRRSVFAGLAMEAQWKQARKLLKWGMTVDIVMFFAWAAEFVYILIGQRCPSGSFDGWCDAYNVATAASCILCFAFGFSVFFDIKDIHASRASPRTRT